MKKDVSYLAFTFAICEAMAGVGDKMRRLSGGTGFLAISSIIFSRLSFNCFAATTTVVFSVIAIVLYGIEGEVFARRRDEFPRAIIVVDWFRSWSCALAISDRRCYVKRQGGCWFDLFY